MTPEQAIELIRQRDYAEAFHCYFSGPAEVLWQEIESLRAFKRGVDEALNSGDGSYRP